MGTKGTHELEIHHNKFATRLADKDLVVAPCMFAKQVCRKHLSYKPRHVVVKIHVVAIFDSVGGEKVLELVELEGSSEPPAKK